MASFVLVHGAWHGGWCWKKVLAELDAAGHQAIAPDLPGHGDDPTPRCDVSFDSYVDRIAAVTDERGPGVVLVGHSMGGMVIGQVAEGRPDTVASLVFLAAMIPTHGHRFADVPTAPELRDSMSIFDDPSEVVFDTASARRVFYADCSDEDVAFAISRLCPQPTGPSSATFELTAAGFGRVPRHYIECLQDAAILPHEQKQLYETHPCESVHSLNTSHSPFFSDPKGVARLLIQIADRTANSDRTGI